KLDRGDDVQNRLRQSPALEALLNWSVTKVISASVAADRFGVALLPREPSWPWALFATTVQCVITK
ncbi:MAG: hypothetical protein KGQ94_16820, partial [Alphaproteobacteria bacterium]|nr:hypothetical protein [Alphaproteobacteria bacterium]